MDDQLHARVEQFLGYMLDCFKRGRFREFTAQVVMPMVVYSQNGNITIAGDREEAALFLAAGWLDVMASAHRFEPRIVEIGCTANGEFPVRVDWRYLAADDSEIKISRVRYIFGEKEDGTFRIHLTEVYGPTWVRAIEMPVGRLT